MRNILIILTFILCFCGCRRYDIEEILLKREDISLTIKGKEILSYKPETFQIGYNSSKNEFRVSDDNIGNWFVLTCRERPSTEGQIVKANLRWTGTSSIKSQKGLSFIVEKTDSEGHIWLWCNDEAIGIVVRES